MFRTAASGSLRIANWTSSCDEASMDDLAYYEMRMLQETVAARIATSAPARECHEDLASAYDLRCRFLRKQDRLSQEQRVEETLGSQSF